MENTDHLYYMNKERGFVDIAATLADYFNVDFEIGNSFLEV